MNDHVLNAVVDKIHADLNHDRFAFVRAWGFYMGSYPYYIERQVAKAQRDNAPANAVHFADDKSEPGGGHWVTVDDVATNNPNLASSLKRYVSERTGE